MPTFGPIKRRELIRCLRSAGFEGPFSGGKHQFMFRDDVTVRVPNPHQGDIGTASPPVCDKIAGRSYGCGPPVAAARARQPA